MNTGSDGDRLPPLAKLNRAAFWSLMGGASGSLALMLRAARRQSSVVLLLIFAIWVLSPFVALMGARLAARRWSINSRRILYSAIAVVTLASLVTYGAVAFGYLNAKVGSVFLLVPLFSWLLISVVVTTAVLLSRKSSN